jgi:hypothetical protein
MAFKFPSSNWQNPRGYERVPDDVQCCVCGSTHDLGRHPEEFYAVCKMHSHMQRAAVGLVVKCATEDSRISKTEFDAGRWNSYDCEAMLPHFSDELLIKHTAMTLKNCSRIKSPPSTYDEAIQLFAAELAKRLLESQARYAFMFTCEHDEGVRKIVIQPIDVGKTCTTDIVLDDAGTIERYEIRRML